MKNQHISMPLMIAFFDIKEQGHILSLKEFIPVPGYEKYDLIPISPWEYGILKLETTSIRIFITSLHPIWSKELQMFSNSKNIRSEIGTVGGFRWLKSDGTIGHLKDGEIMEIST